MLADVSIVRLVNKQNVLTRILIITMRKSVVQNITIHGV